MSPHLPPSSTGAPVEIHEPIRVAVDFHEKKVRPLAFFWAGKKYVVKEVNLVYKHRHGDRWQWRFAVTDESNSYILAYDPEEMVWDLEEIYELTT